MISSSTTRILFVGDLHLGRTPAGVPGQLAAADLGPREAWQRVVAAAIEHEVDAVALAGDLVDQDNDVFEAKALLEEGIGRLTDAGIAVCAVAGNHDTHVLPDLADLIEGLHLLGRGGTWSDVRIDGAGSPVRIVGWSFPDRHHDQSPWRGSSPPAANPSITTLGLLHCDLDVASSRYAPVTSRELLSAGYEGWFLGHIHRPTEPVTTDQPCYLGSVTGLDAGEQGRRGPVLVTVDRDGGLAARRLLLAPLRWEHREVLVDELVTEPGDTLTDADVQSFLLRSVSGIVEELEDELGLTRALGLRLRLTGTLPDPEALHRILVKLDLEKLATSHLGTQVFVEKLTPAVGVEIDLRELSRRSDPAGLLARNLLLLSNEGGERPDAYRTLLDEARRRLIAVNRQTIFQDLDPDMDDQQIVDILQRSGQRSLSLLLAQAGGDDATG